MVLSAMQPKKPLLVLTQWLVQLNDSQVHLALTFPILNSNLSVVPPTSFPSVAPGIVCRSL